jgi:hypothetical protein
MYIYNPDTMEIEANVCDVPINDGYSVIGTKYGAIISGASSTNEKGAWVFNGKVAAQLQSSNYRHAFHGSCLFREKLYLIGGTNSKFVERYSFTDNEWETVANLSRIRHGFAVATTDEAITIMGGMYDCEEKPSRRIERYNGTSWEMLNCKLPYALHNFCAFPVGEDRFFLFGGIRVVGREEMSNDDVIEFDASTDAQPVTLPAHDRMVGMALSHVGVGSHEGCATFILDDAKILKFNTDSKRFSVLTAQTAEPLNDSNDSN